MMGSFHQCYLACILTRYYNQKNQSGVGCHINVNFMGVLSYADDITLICPSIWRLNKMLKISNTLKKNNSILFNKKKITCIKYGDIIKNGEKAFLYGSDLVWKDNVRHLGNCVDITCNDAFDCNAEKSLFIAYFNKMMANYSSLQPTVLINLFKSYCCSFYGSPLWIFNSTGFEKCCKLGILLFVNCCIYHLRHILGYSAL